MNIAGSAYNFVPFGKPQTLPAIQWIQDAAGYWNGSDRGTAADVYRGRVTFADTAANINALQTTLEANREGVALTSIDPGQEIFGMNVDYTGTITATVINMTQRRALMWNKVMGLEVEFQAVSPTLLATSPSLSALRLQEGWEGDKSYEITKHFAVTGTPFYADHRSDVGRFEGSFLQSATEMKAIRAYLLTTARANTVTLPTLGGVTHPFGISKGTGPFNCKVKSWDDERVDLNRWKLRIEFVEA